jgi:transketolase
MVLKSGSGHIASALSLVEIISVLFNKFLSYSNLDQWNLKDRDHFVLSKGHGSLSLYSSLYELGFISVKDINEYLTDGSSYTAFPCSNIPPGIDFASGSLGHGLSVGAGIAYGKMLQDSDKFTYVVLSDGECQEGSIWEAAQFAGHHILSKLVAIVDMNKFQAMGEVSHIINQETIIDRFKSLGFCVSEADGHDIEALSRSIESVKESETPGIVFAHTIKGKGVSFMENKIEWHYLPVDIDLAKKALQDIDKS